MQPQDVRVAGFKNVKKPSDGGWLYLLGQGIHEMGTARMGRDPKNLVLNGIKPRYGCDECLCH